MNEASDPVALAEALIACESVTPARGAVFDALEAMLAPLGFEVHRFIAGEGAEPVENCLAIRRGPAGSAGISPSPATSTSSRRARAGEPPVRARAAQAPGGELLYGRGAVDMKSSIAAMAAAAAATFRPRPARSASSSPATRKAPALHGTRALIEVIRERGEKDIHVVVAAGILILGKYRALRR